MHWIPSHLGELCTPRDGRLAIAGNEAADGLAGAAAREARRQQYEHSPLDTRHVYTHIAREAARLVHSVERLFPLAETVPRKRGPVVLKQPVIGRKRSKPGDNGDGDIT